jgi:hypothetical protein
MVSGTQNADESDDSVWIVSDKYLDRTDTSQVLASVALSGADASNKGCTQTRVATGVLHPDWRETRQATQTNTQSALTVENNDCASASLTLGRGCVHGCGETETKATGS